MAQRAALNLGQSGISFNDAGVQGPPGDAANQSVEAFDGISAINLRRTWD